MNINLWENKSVDSYYTEDIMGSWVKIFLQGTTSNRDGLGSIIQLNFEDGTSQIRQYTGSGYQQQSLQSIHFGGADNNNISSIVVTWPNSGQETFYNLQTNMQENTEHMQQNCKKNEKCKNKRNIERKIVFSISYRN